MPSVTIEIDKRRYKKLVEAAKHEAFPIHQITKILFEKAIDQYIISEENDQGNKNIN